MSYELIRGDATSLPLADDSVDLICTSPPYFALRSYTDSCSTCGGTTPTAGTPLTGGTAKSTLAGKGPQHYKTRERTPTPDCPECNGTGKGHYEGQIGSEDTPQAFLEALWAWTTECRRVLKPSGSLWVNLGDSYSRGSRTTRDGTTDKRRQGDSRVPPCTFVPAKSLMLLPQRYAIGCIDQLGLILRAEVIWSKPNGLPESVTDRVRRSHEHWFHMTKEPRYFSAVDEVREVYAAPTATRTFGNVDPSRGDHGKPAARMDAADVMNPLGKLPGSVWTIPTEPLRVPDHLGVDHFAAFPSEFPRRIILGWSPSGVCVECGEGRRPVVAKEKDVYYGAGEFRSGAQQVKDGAAEVGWKQDEKWRTTATITGYACACPDTTAPTTPAVVLDPFMGTGTTVLTAHHLGRHGVGIDLSADYIRLAKWRCEDPKMRAKVLGVKAPSPQLEGQGVLL